MPLESCCTVTFSLERLNFSSGCPQKRNCWKTGAIQHLGMPISLSSPRQHLLLIFQCENPSPLNGVTMTEYVTAFLHKAIIFLTLNSSRLCSKPSRIVDYLLPTWCKVAFGKEDIFKCYIDYFLLAKIEEV